ncbi:DUF262 domain-containing protein, partial [Tautonia marina]|uniref:DUF262 domain-containing protein n=1 Tax=Tautonia marina TaxID=2653855 RepID=UPI00191C52DA
MAQLIPGHAFGFATATRRRGWDLGIMACWVNLGGAWNHTIPAPRETGMNDNQSQTESLLDIVRGIEGEIILLPEFQRDFRWELDQTYDLFDSLIREIFIGTIIYGKPGFGMTLRQVDIRPRKGKGSRAPLRAKDYTKEEIVQQTQIKNLRVILDGQQRITSVYRALVGIDDVFVVVRRDLDPEVLSSSEPLERILD